MKVLVSGGAGQIGSFLCQALLARGHEVICLDNLITGSRQNIAEFEDDPRFSFSQADVVEPVDVSERVDAVYHLASPASPPEYVTIPLETLAVNSQGTWNLLRLAESHGARFLFASTSEVYGDPEVHPQSEEYWGRVNPNGVRSCYDESKRFGEALTASYARDRGVDARMVRIFNTYGPHCRPTDGRMVPNFISQALRGEPMTIYGAGDQTRSLCFVSDTVEGIRLTMEKDVVPGTVVNIGNPDERTVAEYARVIAAICGIEFRSLHVDLPADDPTRRCPDISRARQLLGWEPRTSLEDGLRRTVKWLRPRVESTKRGRETVASA
jgi:nucleoside-diphosphate-sugar epimerase